MIPRCLCRSATTEERDSPASLWLRQTEEAMNRSTAELLDGWLRSRFLGYPDECLGGMATGR